MEDWKIKRHEFARYVALEKQNMAVIEAAQAYKAKFMEPYGGHGHADTTEERRALFAAVKALEATEAPAAKDNP